MPKWMAGILIGILVIIVAVVIFPPLGDFLQSAGTAIDDVGDKMRTGLGWTGFGGASTK